MTSAAMPAFNPIQYANALKAAGFSCAQAEAQATSLLEALDTHAERFATKDDLKLAVSELRGEMKILSAELRGEIAPLRWMCGATALGTAGTFLSVIAMVVKTFA